MKSRLPYLVFEEAPTWRPPQPPDLSRFDTIELDIESDGTDWARGSRPVGYAVGTAAGTWYLPTRHRGGGNLDEAVVKRWLERELRGKHIRNLNTKFDIHMTRVDGVDLAAQDNTFHDVAHSAALLDDHRTSFSLEALARAELGEGKLDPGPKDGIADLPAGVVAPYAERDVALVRRLADVYDPQIQRQNLGRVAALENAIIPVCVEMERNGMPLNLERLDHWTQLAESIYYRLLDELRQLVGFSVNPDSPSDMVRLFNTCGEPIVRTAKGNPSFTAPVVQAAAARHPAIQLAWRIGKLTDLRNKYLIKYSREHVNGTLHATLHQLKFDGDEGTVSGRFSCVRPNMQQVMGKDKHERAYGWLYEYVTEEDPFLVKRLFVPKGGVWCSADMKQVEYRIFAHYTGSDRLIQRYRDDIETDFHKIVGEFIAPYRETITRTEIKTFNFLSIFGGGPGAAARNLNIDMPDAMELSDAYHDAFPEARELLDQAMYVANKRGYVKTMLGRRGRFLGQKWKRERVHKALNAIVQGTAADANKLTLVDIYRRRRELDITMRMTVHDSLEVDLHDSSKLDAYRAALNEPRLPLSVSILWDIKTGTSWGACA